jgi:plastocyanin
MINKYKKFRIPVLVILLIILLITTFHKPGVSKSRPAVRPAGPITAETTVTLTNKGFEPANITIKSGETVKWINKSGSEKASVNSDNYPTNNLYPEINLGQFGKGSFLVHIFYKPGTFTYHDQFNLKNTGTVVVVK